jgi:hypothetical protein
MQTKRDMTAVFCRQNENSLIFYIEAFKKRKQKVYFYLEMILFPKISISLFTTVLFSKK